MKVGDVVVRDRNSDDDTWWIWKDFEGFEIVGGLGVEDVGTVLEVGNDFVRILCGDVVGWIRKSKVCAVTIR